MVTIHARRRARRVAVWRGETSLAPARHPADWDEDHLPWDPTGTGWEAYNPTGLVPVDLAGNADDNFQDRIDLTVSLNGNNPTLIMLPDHTAHIKSITLRGASTRSTTEPFYDIGFWNPQAIGFVSETPGESIIQMDANILTAEQLGLYAHSAYEPSEFVPYQVMMGRIDARYAPIFLANVMFTAADQQFATLPPGLVAQGVSANQPAPFNGIVLQGSKLATWNNSATVFNCQFMGNSHAVYNAPPGEMANISTQYLNILMKNVHSDGRLHPSINPKRPARGGSIMTNNDRSITLEDTWFHDNNVSRYAYNGRNRSEVAQSSKLTHRRTKISRIGFSRNIDPDLNGGVQLGPVQAAPVGYEASNNLIEWTDSVICTEKTWQRPGITITEEGGVNPSGGKFVGRNLRFVTPAWPHLDGFALFNITKCWWLDNLATAIDIVTPAGNQLSPWTTKSWPPSPAAITAAGITPETHYIVHDRS